MSIKTKPDELKKTLAIYFSNFSKVTTPIVECELIEYNRKL